MRLPFDGSYPITQGFSSHNPAVAGVDYGTPMRTPVYATEAGTAESGTDETGARYVSIVGNSNRKWELVHLDEYVVSTGQKVVEGQLVGYSGRTGNVTGPHLHLACIAFGRRVNFADELTWVLLTQRPDVIQSGQDVHAWWAAWGCQEMKNQLEKLGRKEEFVKLGAWEDKAWLKQWYIQWGSKDYGTPPYIWGAQPTPPVETCQQKLLKANTRIADLESRLRKINELSKL